MLLLTRGEGGGVLLLTWQQHGAGGGSLCLCARREEVGCAHGWGMNNVHSRVASHRVNRRGGRLMQRCVGRRSGDAVAVASISNSAPQLSELWGGERRGGAQGSVTARITARLSRLEVT